MQMPYDPYPYSITGDACAGRERRERASERASETDRHTHPGREGGSEGEGERDRDREHTVRCDDVQALGVAKCMRSMRAVECPGRRTSQVKSSQVKEEPVASHAQDSHGVSLLLVYQALRY